MSPLVALMQRETQTKGVSSLNQHKVSSDIPHKCRPELCSTSPTSTAAHCPADNSKAEMLAHVGRINQASESRITAFSHVCLISASHTQLHPATHPKEQSNQQTPTLNALHIPAPQLKPAATKPTAIRATRLKSSPHQCRHTETALAGAVQPSSST